MPIHVSVDENLLREAMEHHGSSSEHEAVEEALRTLIRIKKQERIRQLRGKLGWEGNLDDMRHDDHP